jgi:AcrR family transcriptional regulator
MVFSALLRYNKRKDEGMDQLRDALIQATIAAGAENPANKRFSTKLIAENCGVSEFTLFSLFKTKDALVEAAVETVREDFVSALSKASLASKDISSLIHALLYHAFNVPTYTIFLANYGLWTGRVESDPEKKKAAFAQDVQATKKAFVFLADEPDEVVFLVGNYLWRNLNYAVEEVYDGLVEDSREYRADCAELIARGLNGMLKEEA